MTSLSADLSSAAFGNIGNFADGPDFRLSSQRDETTKPVKESTDRSSIQKAFWQALTGNSTPANAEVEGRIHMCDPAEYGRAIESPNCVALCPGARES